ncbi:MAG: 23S rRNA methyltransferase [Gemmatimonadota bacterium]|nr:MAG: 23S rRNA methyltransferase [Gemmatimonadota bacterium]
MKPTTEPIDITEPFEVTAGTAVAGGRCLARHEGKVVLVSGALPGERVRVRVTKDEKRYAEAEVTEILEPNPRRREAPCAHAADCGGCDWQYAERDLQLEMKRGIVIDAFRRLGELDVQEQLEGPSEVGEEFRTRQRIRLSFDPAGRPGLLRRGTHDVVPIDGCLQMEASFDEVTLPWVRLLPPWKKVTVRHDDEGHVVLALESGKPANEKDRKRFGKITKKMERPPSVVGLLADAVPLAGERTLRFHVQGKVFRADATSFFQGSRPGTIELLDTVNEFLGDDRQGTLLDLYAGVGLFAVTMGKGFRQVVATEADARAVKHLKYNLKRHAVRAEARAESAEVTLAGKAAEGEAEAETVILDPPRIGLTREARRALVARSPRRIVSISCDPATGARDAGVLVRAGWKLERLRAIDLFPTTAHVETVALLVRPPVG